MRIPLIALFVFLFTSGLGARPLPLTAKEVGLMLRSGYSSEAVISGNSPRVALATRSMPLLKETLCNPVQRPRCCKR